MVGETVGYQVRFERKVSPRTRIEVVTEGVLLRRLQADPELGATGLLIFDEFHERSLNSDLGLALSLDAARGLREDLRLLVMSASLDPAPLAELLPAQVVDAPGRSFPVETLWSTMDADIRDPVPACLRLIDEALAACAGDILVFMPGRREIEALIDAARDRIGAAVDLVALYGEMSSADQDRVLRAREAGEARRVIVATDIAETSLTVDGVDGVIDSGLSRKPVFDPSSGLTRLQTGWISRASALQRGGRAGRQRPGRHYRAWTESRERRLDAWSEPEICRADLAGLVLQLAAWGMTSAGGLAWLDAPPAAHWQQASDLLRQLHAIDNGGRVTAVGRRMAGLPLHPRLAHVLASVADGQRPLAADVVALLSERDPLRRTPDGRCADIELRIEALHAWRSRRPDNARGDGGNADRQALRQVDQVARQLRQALASDSGSAAAASAVDARRLPVGECVAMAYPDRVAMCTSADGRRYLMRNGRAAMLKEHDPLCHRRWLAIAAVDAGRRDGTIWSAAELEATDVERLFGDDIQRGREVRWDDDGDDVVARVVARLDALVLEERAVPLHPDDPTGEILCEQVRLQGLSKFFDDAPGLRARVATARRHDPEGDWPDLGDAALLASLGDWLLPWLQPGKGAQQLRRLDLEQMLTQRLGWERQQRLDDWLPLAVETPAGTRRQVRYAADADPVLSVPLQEVLGLAQGPRLMQGRLPLVLELLSPAGRPLQVTADLAGFWAGAYSAVRKEMRGRYPKHFWPEDPASAQATRFTKRRM